MIEVAVVMKQRMTVQQGEGSDETVDRRSYPRISRRSPASTTARFVSSPLAFMASHIKLSSITMLVRIYTSPYLSIHLLSG